MASKNLILRLMEVLNLLTTNCWAPEALNLLLTTNQFLQNSSKILQKSSRRSPKNPQKSPKLQILHVSRRSIRSVPFYSKRDWLNQFTPEYVLGNNKAIRKKKTRKEVMPNMQILNMHLVETLTRQFMFSFVSITSITLKSDARR